MKTETRGVDVGAGVSGPAQARIAAIRGRTLALRPSDPALRVDFPEVYRSLCCGWSPATTARHHYGSSRTPRRQQFTGELWGVDPGR